jgi:hypothetical protein
MSSLLSSVTRRRIAAFAALLALLAAQALGLAHRVAHSDAPPGVSAAAGGQHDHADHDGHDHSPALTALALFDHHHDEGSPECRLIDQAGHADAVPAGGSAALAFAPAPFERPTARELSPRAAPPLPYCARAPPSFLA